MLIKDIPFGKEYMGVINTLLKHWTKPDPFYKKFSRRLEISKDLAIYYDKRNRLLYYSKP